MTGPTGQAPDGLGLGHGPALARHASACVAGGGVMPKGCRHCGVVFTPRKSWQDYCVAACRRAAWKARRDQEPGEPPECTCAWMGPRHCAAHSGEEPPGRGETW